jgi:nucleoside phosphorylase
VLPIGTAAAVGGATACEIEAMEGFGVLRACVVAGVPAVELRVVSNRYGETNWRFEEAFELLGTTLDRLDVV